MNCAVEVPLRQKFGTDAAQNRMRRRLSRRFLRYSATVVSCDSDIVSADPHGAIGFEQSSVQLLSSPEFDHLPMRIEYSI